MKKIIILTIFLFSIKSFCQITYPQKLKFYLRDESASYIDQNGKKQYQEISKLAGLFEISLSKAAEVKNSPIVEIYGDPNEKGYYANIATLDNIKLGEKLYEGNLFYSTALKTGVNIYLAFDKSNLIIMSKNKVVRYYLK